jgi:hypothetical protein
LPDRILELHESLKKIIFFNLLSHYFLQLHGINI